MLFRDTGVTTNEVGLRTFYPNFREGLQKYMWGLAVAATRCQYCAKKIVATTMQEGGEVLSQIFNFQINSTCLKR